jgi:hypothetical protein
MRSLLRSSSLAIALLAGTIVTGCALGPTPAPARPSSSRSAPKQVYSVWEFDTIGELDQLLDIKGCEGWRLAESFTRGEKIVAILVADGLDAPATNPKCRPTA